MTGLWCVTTQGPVKVIGIRRGDQFRLSSLRGLGLLDESGKGGLIIHGEIG